MKYAVHFIVQFLAMLVMLPKAIGLSLMFYADNLSLGRVSEGPGDLKEVEKAVKQAMEVMQENIKKVQDIASNALEEVRQEGTLHKKTNEQLTELSTLGKQLSDNVKGLQDRQLELEQKMALRKTETPEAAKSLEQIITESEEFKAALARGAGAKHMDPVMIGSFHKTQIVNATGQNQPLVPSQRVNGLIVPPEQRLTIRDLIPAARTTSNLIEYASEATFTNSAAPQGGGSPGNAEGELKAESAMTFTLANAPVITLAHWIPASRQVLADASLLAGHISTRLLYGLKLEEEEEILTNTGAAGTLNGLINQATAFSYGVTNQTALDTLLKARLQVSLSNFDASGIVLHPIQWTDIVLLKDTTGQYLFSNPQDVTTARLWGLPVLATQSMTQGRFLMGAFNLCAQIWDREDATIRVSENVNDHFIRNLVAILAEERLALTVYRSSALVTGAVSHAG
jgi:HK97 family phage major capsid protein